MSERKLVPNIRFKGFEEDWEKLKLKSCVDRIKGNDGRMDLPTLTISASNGWMSQKERFSSNIAGKEQKNYTLLKKGELAYNHGNSRLAPYGTVFELKNYKEALVPRVYHSFKTKFMIKADFLEYLFHSKKIDQELRKLITSGARMDGLLNISYDSFTSITVKAPNTSEQQKIGDLFAKLDRLLDLQQQKLDQLELLKKALLQKLFPKQGVKIPELRFKGFAEEWKKDTIGDLIKSVGYKNFLADASSLGEYPVIQQGEEPVLGYSSKKPFQKYNDVVLFGDHTLSLYKPKSPFLIATDGIKIVFVKNWNGQFLYAFLQKYKPHSEGYKRHFTILKSKVGKYPLDIKEQQKIGNLLAKIDRLIELENKKSSNLKKVKKSLLQNMFVE